MVAPYTRLGAEGYGVRREGSFSGKTPGVVGHPVGTITRLGGGGYGVRRYGSFAGKTASSGSNTSLACDTGTFTISGNALTSQITVSLATGAYVITGNDATLSNTTPGGAHPVGIITRLGAEGYGVRRTGNFGNKTTGSITPPRRVGGLPGRVHHQPTRSFNRKYFNELMEAKRAAEQRARQLKGKYRKALGQALLAIEYVAPDAEPQKLELLTNELWKAVNASTSETIALARAARALALSMDDDEEEEAIMLLLLH